MFLGDGDKMMCLVCEGGGDRGAHGAAHGTAHGTAHGAAAGLMTCCVQAAEFGVWNPTRITSIRLTIVADHIRGLYSVIISDNSRMSVRKCAFTPQKDVTITHESVNGYKCYPLKDDKINPLLIFILHIKETILAQTKILITEIKLFKK